MTYKYSPPEGTRADVTRRDIAQEFKRWNTQAGETVVSDYDLPLANVGEVPAECRFLLRGRPVKVKIGTWPAFNTNLRCCYLVIRDMRLAEARGMDGAMREVYAQLPPPSNLPAKAVNPFEFTDPYDVLQVARGADLDICEVAWKTAMKKVHSDTGGANADDRKAAALNAAIEKIRELAKVPA